MNLSENIKIALRSLKANLLRSALTLMIIAVGITCLVGILTAIDSILFSMTDSFNRLGANSFNVRPLRENISGNRNGRNAKRADPLIYAQVQEFKKKYKYSTAKVSIESWCSSNAELQFKDTKTNPTVVVRGIDENYFDVSSYNLEAGRNFTNTEVTSSSNKVILGSGLVEELFNGKVERAIGKIVSINAGRYKVIGALASKGSSFGGDEDRRVFIPITKAKQIYGYPKKNYNLL